ncbi:SRPBCC family protein [Streptomyces collinus]|uniref:SRPBCC family protein n=1 Tax=Streptomyces collinus TaxID=42684 RepID=UPI0033EF84EC
MPVPPGSSTVEITLEPVPEGTLLRLVGWSAGRLVGWSAGRLVHRDLPSPEACAAHEEGWTHYTGRLALAAAGGDPGPDPWM